MHNVQRATLTVNDSAVTQVCYLEPKPQLGGPEVALPQPVAGTIADARDFFSRKNSLHWDGWNSWMEFIESSRDSQMPTPQPVTSTVKFNNGVVRERTRSLLQHQAPTCIGMNRFQRILFKNSYGCRPLRFGLKQGISKYVWGRRI